MVDDIYELFWSIAAAMGNPDRGVKMAEQLKKGIDRLSQQSPSPAKPEKPRSQKAIRVFFQLSESPVITVGSQSYLTDLAARLGAENVFGTLKGSYPRPSVESVVKADPDVIVVLSLGTDKALFEKIAKSWERFPEMKAVKSKRVHILQSDELLRPSTRLLEGMARLKQLIQ
jgi:ABC-type Fe3+-hydroxamate transport system substrate-binding protein